MPRGRVAARDYEDSVMVMVPIPRDLFRRLQIQCAQRGVTMKEVLHDSNIKNIKGMLGVK